MLSSFLRLRILPVTMVACGLFLGFKIEQIVNGQRRFDQWGAAEAIAAEAPKEEAKSGASADKEPAEKKKDEEHSEDAKDVKEGKEDTDAKEGESSGAAGAEQDAAAKPEEEKCEFNQIELDILQSLSARREEIEKWSDDVEMQAKLLEATEIRIDDKVKQMQGLKTQVEALLKRYDQQEQVELRSLVKIYENMKPKDAARIFNEMEMGIMLEVVDMMSERKAAPVLANMDPKKAKDLTVELAEKRRLKQKATEGMPADEGAPSAAAPGGTP